MDELDKVINSVYENKSQDFKNEVRLLLENTIKYEKEHPEVFEEHSKIPRSCSLNETLGKIDYGYM